jgi:GxxExxY protein
MADLIYKDEVYAIIGAAMEVYNQLGPGFSEAVYQEAMEIEIASRNIPNLPQQDIFIKYKGIKLKQYFKPDLIFYDKIIVEIKAIDRLTSREESQLLNYLKATGMLVGLLINFGGEKDLEWKRMILTRTKPKVIKSLPPFPRNNHPKSIRED